MNPCCQPTKYTSSRYTFFKIVLYKYSLRTFFFQDQYKRIKLQIIDNKRNSLYSTVDIYREPNELDYTNDQSFFLIFNFYARIINPLLSVNNFN